LEFKVDEVEVDDLEFKVKFKEGKVYLMSNVIIDYRKKE
jgi:hypothetical protein